MGIIKTHFTMELMLMFLVAAVCIWAAVHYYNYAAPEPSLPYAKSVIVWRR